MLVASHVSGVANMVAAQRQIVLANKSVAHSSADVAPIGHLHTKCVAHWPGRKIVLHQLGPWRVIAHNRSWTGHRAGNRRRQPVAFRRIWGVAVPVAKVGEQVAQKDSNEQP
jgi:hypothetical protein